MSQKIIMKFTYASGSKFSNNLVPNYVQPQSNPPPLVQQPSMIRMLQNNSQNVVLRNNRGTPCMQFGISKTKIGCGCGGN